MTFISRIIAAKSTRSKSAKGLCDKGYYVSKKMYYYGVKVHTLGQKRYRTLPLSSASENDLTVAKEWLNDVRNIDIFAGKVYASEP